MCGIAGAIGATSPEVTSAVERMSDALAHRGPDAHGLFEARAEGGGVVLAHRRLSILDLSDAGTQPMRDGRGNAISYNGEVYNFRALRDAIGGDHRSETDTEAVLQSCAARGVEATLPELRGMFAFAYWDAGTSTLHLVRDRMGIKPLYCARVRTDAGPVLLFASEVRALLASGLVERKLSAEGLRTFVWNGFVCDPHTIIEGVEALPPGHRLALSANAPHDVEPERWWTLPGSAMVPGARDELAEALRSAVQSRLISDVPLGVFLSGGVDSSAVAALAAGAGRVRTFCIGFPEMELDESRYAEDVARALGTEHTTIPLDERAFRAGLSDALDSLDQPTFDAVNTFFVSRAVKEAGLTVALAGTGGDELFGGYTSFRDLPLAERAARAAAGASPAVLDAAASALTRLLTGRPGEAPPQTKFGKLRDVLATEGARVPLYQVSYALFTREFLAQLTGDVDENWGLSRALYATLAALVEREPALHAVSVMELALFLGQRLLPDTDATSMASSLEVRVPLVDHLVIEAAARVLPDRRCLPAQQKRMLKELAFSGEHEPVRALVEREKAGFELPFATWCRRGLRAEMDDVFEDSAALTAVGLRPEAVRSLWRSFLDEAPGIYWSRVWSLFVLARWAKRHEASL